MDRRGGAASVSQETCCRRRDEINSEGCPKGKLVCQPALRALPELFTRAFEAVSRGLRAPTSIECYGSMTRQRDNGPSCVVTTNGPLSELARSNEFQDQYLIQL
jgi:hypothetical protein